VIASTKAQSRFRRSNDTLLTVLAETDNYQT